MLCMLSLEDLLITYLHFMSVLSCSCFNIYVELIWFSEFKTLFPLMVKWIHNISTQVETLLWCMFFSPALSGIFLKKYKENFTNAKFVFKLKSFEAKWQKVFLLLMMKYSFYWKFALNIKLNVNIVALIESCLEINTNKYKKNLFSNFLRIQLMAFQTVTMQSRLWQ